MSASERRASGLELEDLVVGEGAPAAPGDTVTLHYRATLADGVVIDSSFERGVPYRFTLDMGEVVPGFDEGVAGMRRGGRRRLLVPPALGYGTRGARGVPPGATLTFEIELLEIGRRR